jgi:hypothetical protein
MRTTVEIDDDLLLTLKELANQEGFTLGQVISKLTRQSLPSDASPKVRNGVRLFTPNPSNTKPDLSVVNALRDDG